MYDLQSVHDFWNTASCGERLYLDNETMASYEAQADMRYSLEPYILSFANFNAYTNKKVLEIGVGLGADHQKFAEAGAQLTGIDLTERAVKHVQKRLALFKLKSNVIQGNAESLDFQDNTFDLVYSWGVLHHSPNTPRTITELYRVLKPGGVAKVMIYNKYSLVGFMLWLYYALFRLKPFTSLNTIYANHLESPGTKAYTPKEARRLFSQFNSVQIKTVLTHGDLLESNVGQKHSQIVIKIAKSLYPRKLIKRFGTRWGLFMLIHAIK